MAQQPQQKQTQQQGPPSNEQLAQFLMLSKGLNRESATLEVMSDPEKIQGEFQKMKQLIETGQAPEANGGEGQQKEQSSKTGGQPGTASAQGTNPWEKK
jgi:hypothetical protein